MNNNNEGILKVINVLEKHGFSNVSCNGIIGWQFELPEKVAEHYRKNKLYAWIYNDNGKLAIRTVGTSLPVQSVLLLLEQVTFCKTVLSEVLFVAPEFVKSEEN